MAWDAPQIVAVGEIIEASWGNAVRSSLMETAAGKAESAGDLFVGTGLNALKRLALGNAREVLQVNAAGDDVEYTDAPEFDSISTDTINEKTAAAGVTVDGVLLKDGQVQGGQSVLGTPQATTSGSTADIAAIPSWVKRVVIQLVGVSGTSGATLRLRLGTSGGLEDSGYSGGSGPIVTNSFIVASMAAASGDLHGAVTLIKENASNNTWVMTSGIFDSDDNSRANGAGSKSLSGALTQIRLFWSSGNFDAGEINVHLS